LTIIRNILKRTASLDAVIIPHHFCFIIFYDEVLGRKDARTSEKPDKVRPLTFSLKFTFRSHIHDSQYFRLYVYVEAGQHFILLSVSKNNLLINPFEN